MKYLIKAPLAKIANGSYTAGLAATTTSVKDGLHAGFMALATCSRHTVRISRLEGAEQDMHEIPWGNSQITSSAKDH